ncbi:MAG TPA: hypothetical protein VGF85_10160 [Opitutaceae bacterium]|jgi:hypothetical protein
MTCTRLSASILAGLLLLAVSSDAFRLGAGDGAASTRRVHSYATRFEKAENPLSEGGRWLSARSVGHDWADVACEPGFAYGLENGLLGYDDATALLSGDWGPDQEAEATVHATNPNLKTWEEVELRLRSTLAPHSCTGYEILFRCSKADEAYSDIVRWDGPLAKFTYLTHKEGSKYGVKEGDVVKATMIGPKITVYLNGTLIAEAWDRTFTSGSPGVGFFLQADTGLNKNYGFTRFSATDAP